MPFPPLHSLPRPVKRAIFFTLDTALVPLSLYGAFALRYGTLTPLEQVQDALVLFGLMSALGALVISACRAVPDARIIAQNVDAILYTVKWDSTSKRQVREGLRAFENVNLKPTGLVLAQISAKGMKKYGYGDSYGAYNEYYNS